MKFKEAASFAYKLCSTRQEEVFLWDADAYKKWADKPVTDAQKFMLSRIKDYTDIDIRSLNKAQR